MNTTISSLKTSSMTSLKWKIARETKMKYSSFYFAYDYVSILEEFEDDPMWERLSSSSEVSPRY